MSLFGTPLFSNKSFFTKLTVQTTTSKVSKGGHTVKEPSCSCCSPVWIMVTLSCKTGAKTWDIIWLINAYRQ